MQKKYLGIAAYLAAKRNCAGLVLLAPYHDIFDLYNAIIPIFNNAKVIKFKGIAHEKYLYHKNVAATVKNFCE